MLLLDVLKMMDLGNSVAEFDDSLEDYFVETDSFRQLVEDRVDIVAGDKVNGKTALFRILEKRYTEIGPLGEVDIVPAFNPTGSPIFQRLTEGDALDEGHYSQQDHDCGAARRVADGSAAGVGAKHLRRVLPRR